MALEISSKLPCPSNSARYHVKRHGDLQFGSARSNAAASAKSAKEDAKGAARSAKDEAKGAANAVTDNVKSAYR